MLAMWTLAMMPVSIYFPIAVAAVFLPPDCVDVAVSLDNRNRTWQPPIEASITAELPQQHPISGTTADRDLNTSQTSRLKLLHESQRAHKIRSELNREAYPPAPLVTFPLLPSTQHGYLPR